MPLSTKKSGVIYMLNNISNKNEGEIKALHEISTKSKGVSYEIFNAKSNCIKGHYISDDFCGNALDVNEVGEFTLQSSNDITVNVENCKYGDGTTVRYCCCVILDSAGSCVVTTEGETAAIASLDAGMYKIYAQAGSATEDTCCTTYYTGQFDWEIKFQ